MPKNAIRVFSAKLHKKIFAESVTRNIFSQSADCGNEGLDQCLSACIWVNLEINHILIYMNNNAINNNAIIQKK